MAVSGQQDKMSAEPVGIVISRGKRDEPAPAFWAYVWGPAPELSDAPSTEPKAA
ncbi:MAG TPA: hypothetical protein VF041_10895 [Gemmatimonadaceae bacterium]